MKLLYLSHRVPFPPTKGEKVRAYEVLRRLAARHEVHLLALAGPGEGGPVPELTERCAGVEIFPLRPWASRLRAALAALGPRPLTLAWFGSPRMAARVRQLSGERRFDAVIAYTAAMTPYAARIPGVRRVVDLVDVDSEKWAQLAAFSSGPKSLVYRLEARRMRALERALGSHFDLVLVTTERERRLLLAAAPAAPVEVFRVGSPRRPEGAGEGPSPRRPRLLFTGQMDYLPNVDGIARFAERVFPRLRREHPDLELLVVGRSPTRRVRALAGIRGVTVTGEVPEIAPYLAAAQVFVAPLRVAQGVQMKVIEAMAAGLPVVCSARVMEGLADAGLEAGRDLLVARDDKELEAALRRLLASGELRARIGGSGRERAAAGFRWEDSVGRFEERLERLVRGEARSAPPERAPAAGEIARA